MNYLSVKLKRYQTKEIIFPKRSFGKLTSNGIRFLVIINFLFIFFSGSIIYGQDSKINIRFIDYFFENASPLSWETQGDTVLRVTLMPDYQRDTHNCQTDHWYFKVEGDKGSNMKIILAKLKSDVYNGKQAINWWNYKNGISCYISYDQNSWKAIKTSSLPDNELIVEFPMKGESVYVANIPPYTISDLENLKRKIENNDLVKIHNIGTTIEERPLEIIQLGDSNASKSILIRARAHPWESGGNWVVEGLINKFISMDSKKWQEAYCVYIMPMANKDGVAHGMTRFNVKGMDLNRNWDEESDPNLCPEKYALERFIESLIKEGKKPCLGIDIHNDDYGGIFVGRHCIDDAQYVKNVQWFEKLMRKHTSFSEDVIYPMKTTGQSDYFACFEDGLTERYGIESVVYELNANYISSLDKIPDATDWIRIGENLNVVFYEYVKNLSSALAD